MVSLKQGPKLAVDAIKLNHELLNTPRIGTENNFAFTSNQLNLAHATEWNSSKRLFLSESGVGDLTRSAVHRGKSRGQHGGKVRRRAYRRE